MSRRIESSGTLVVLLALTAACSGGTANPAAPSPQPAVTAGFGNITVQASARCFQFAGDPACFSGARVGARGATSAAAAPTAPSGLTATAVGSTVTLTWLAPTGTDPATSYVIEAGSAPGLANLANFSTGNNATTFSAGGVPAGSYYVRVRASNSNGASAPSNEVLLVVGGSGPAPCTAPGAPAGLTSSVSGTTITLQWSVASGATSYVLQAGSSPGLSNLASADIGNTTSYTATGVGNGTYYVRVVAKNACGSLSAASNEVTIVVGSTAPGGFINFFGRDSCTYLTVAYGWTGCKADVNVNVTKIVRSGYVSAYILWSCADYFAICDWYFYGDVPVAAGTAPGLITISTTSTYLPRINCSNSIGVVVEIYDGPQAISNAWPRGAPLLYSVNTRWVGFGCP